jgi:hypothetical protein
MTILQATPRISFRYAFLVLPFLFSCNEKPESVEKTETTPTELTIEQKKQVLQQVTPTTTKTTNSQGVALNPPHGQPNHRCDIKVGEPLNTPAASSNTTSGNGGINPPHGQPGHRCDIKVGDPL